jgi:hypothetical protein
VHADEHHLEAADEVAERQQLEIAVTECLARRFADGLVMAGGRRAIFGSRRSAPEAA